MGLDQYAYAAPPQHLPDGVTVGFEKPDFITDASYPDCFFEDSVFGHLFHSKIEGARSLAYWRKHPNLDGLIHEIAKTRPEYNSEKHQQWGNLTAPVRLFEADIDLIEKATIGGTLPETSGFFYGKSLPDDDDLTLEFCKRARAALVEGLAVYYENSW